jgi:hypothetical protein
MLLTAEEIKKYILTCISKYVIVSPDEVRDTLILDPSATAAASTGNCLVSVGYRPNF